MLHVRLLIVTLRVPADALDAPAVFHTPAAWVLYLTAQLLTWSKSLHDTTAVVGFVNAFMKTGDKRYKMAERKTWEFIRDHMIVKTRPAEWYMEVSKDGVPDLAKPLVDEWKCPYHNIRMCCEILRRNERASEEL